MGGTKGSKARSFRSLTLTFRGSDGCPETGIEFRLRFLTPTRHRRNNEFPSELVPSNFRANPSARKDWNARSVLYSDAPETNQKGMIWLL